MPIIYPNLRLDYKVATHPDIFDATHQPVEGIVLIK
jgi:hypothetical protein